MNELLILSDFDLHKTLFIIHQVCFKSFLYKSNFLDMNILDYEYFLIMVLNVLMLVCASLDIRGFSDFKCSFSQNLIDLIKLAVIQGLFLCLNLLYFTSLVVEFVFIAFVNSYYNRL